MLIEIDENSGFCFGVTTAIRKAEEELQKNDSLYCLGDIVHNGEECDRLRSLGLKSIDHDCYKTLTDTKVLLRAHGEPPATYALAKNNRIELIDATCPVVLQLQKRIRSEYLNNPDAQIVIFGKPGHAEVLGLIGQTDGKAVVLSTSDDVKTLNFQKDIRLFSQTTQPLAEFQKIEKLIRENICEPASFKSYDTICRQVNNRIPRMLEFASRHEAILFVCGKKSSNGRVLFKACQSVNPQTYFVEGAADIDFSKIQNVSTLGICGATSTPKWLMEQCKNAVLEKLG